MINRLQAMRIAAVLRATFLTTLLTAMLAGCSQWYYEMGERLDEASVPSAEKQVSLQEVLDQFGPPLRITATNAGYAMAWEHWWLREQSLGFNLGAFGADFLSIDYGELHLRGSYVLMTFDRDHTLTSANYSEWSNRGGGGRSIQPFAEVVEVVDSDDIRVALPQHEWGGALLAPSTKTVNRQSSTATGQSGLEQRGTPVHIGQHSLELD
ncbi:MAG: hypothetical protein HKN19_16530 [Halioglobus sp.]|nr:hypothetical protein [Halioglobus sp.]